MVAYGVTSQLPVTRKKIAALLKGYFWIASTILPSYGKLTVQVKLIHKHMAPWTYPDVRMHLCVVSQNDTVVIETNDMNV